MSRRVLAGLLCVVVMAGALGCAYFGGGGLTPAQQLELLEGDVASAFQVYEIWSKGERPEDLQKLVQTWVALRNSVLRRLEILMTVDGIDRARLDAVAAKVAALDAAVKRDEALE